MILAVILVLMAYISRFIYKIRLLPWTDEAEEKYGRLVAGISLKRNEYTIWYFSIFMIRRLIFAMIPVVFRQQFS